MLKEQITEILGADTGLTEQHIADLAAAVDAKLLEAKVATAEAHAAELQTLKEQAEADKAEAVELAEARLDEAVDAAVAEVLKEHEQRFIDADQHARIVAAFGVIKEAFEKNGFDLNENAVATELQAKLDESKSDYQNLFERNTALKEDLAEVKAELELAQRSIVFAALTEGLADTTREKVGQLVEAVTFDNLNEFRDGVKLIVEQVKGKDEAEAKGKDDKQDGEDDGDADDKEGKLKESVVDAHGRPTKRLSDMTPQERQAYYRAAK